MSFMQFFMRKLTLFFTLTTLITVAIVVVGSAFDPEPSFGYDALLTPLQYAACCVLPTFVTYSKRELQARELLPRMILEFLLIEGVILGIAYNSPAIDTSRTSVILTIAGSVLVIYLLAHLFSWLRDCVEARKINADLMKFQQFHKS